VSVPQIQRLEIDAMHLHSFVRSEDEIYFFYEYTARKNFSYSPGNGLISNLKKDTLKFGHNPLIMRHKEAAINASAEMISHGLNPAWLEGALLVPVPPSKVQGDPAYDDRMLRVASRVRILGDRPRPAASAALVRQKTNLPKSHECADGERPSIEALVASYEIDESFANKNPARIAILDDMLTTGRHFRAMTHVISERLPNCSVIGVFVTRRILPEGAGLEALFPDI
jgi:hypothetical protein